ncbi:hypothetical protein, partial [Collinsella sp. CLA-ER-H5]|uniref:hypothetical protein n=1 Tax=Collinsella sp. CLA-ER-H5 TaxID=3136222 RepID=UPI0032BF2425
HGIGGILGGVLTGLFCVPELSWTGKGGLFYTSGASRNQSDRSWASPPVAWRALPGTWNCRQQLPFYQSAVINTNICSIITAT